MRPEKALRCSEVVGAGEVDECWLDKMLGDEGMSLKGVTCAHKTSVGRVRLNRAKGRMPRVQGHASLRVK